MKDSDASALLGSFIGVALADVTLAQLRATRADYVEGLAEICQAGDLGRHSWVIYIDGSGIGLGIKAGALPGMLGECISVPVHHATRFERAFADRLIVHAKGGEFADNERAKRLKVMDIRDAITCAIGAIDDHMSNIERSRVVVKEYLETTLEAEAPKSDKDKPTDRDGTKHPK